MSGASNVTDAADMPAELRAELECPICGSLDCEHTEEERADGFARRQAEQPPGVLSHDETAQKKARAKDKNADRLFREDLAELMKVKWGRRFMFDLLRRTHVELPSFNLAALDPARIYIMEGERNCGLNYLTFVKQFCFDDYLLMLQENRRKA